MKRLRRGPALSAVRRRLAVLGLMLVAADLVVSIIVVVTKAYGPGKPGGLIAMLLGAAGLALILSFGRAARRPKESDET